MTNLSKLTLSLALMAVSVAPTGAPAQEADLILRNGKIVTVDRDFSTWPALAIKGERLLKVGREDDVMTTKGPNTRVIDLEGKTVVPGLIDSHVHPTDACMIEFDHPIPDMETIQDVLDYIKSRRRPSSRGSGSWCARCSSRGCASSGIRRERSLTPWRPSIP